MVGTALIDVEQAVAGIGAVTHAVEISALEDEPVCHWMSRLGLPLGFSAGVWVWCVDEVEAMGEEGEEVAKGLDDVLRAPFASLLFSAAWLLGGCRGAICLTIRG